MEEVPLMNSITGFEAGINAELRDPYLFAGLGGLSEFFTLRNFWTWGVLLLAAIAAFSGVLNGIKIANFQLESRDSAISEPSVQSDDDDPDDERCSISPSGPDCSDRPPSTSEISSFVGEEDFRLLGSMKSGENRRKNRNFSLVKGSSAFHEEEEERDADCFSGGVVKLWNELGFGFGRSNGVISMWDLNRGEILTSFMAGESQIPANTTPSPSVLVSAGAAGLRIWDARVGGRTPAAAAKWQTLRRRVVSVDSDELGKVRVREDRGAVMVRDMRSFASPFDEITEYNDQMTWFDADAVMVDNAEGVAFDGDLTEKCWGPSASVRSRCREVMRWYLF